MYPIQCKPVQVIATIGPTLESPSDIRTAIENGVRLFRLPCGYRHRDHISDAKTVCQVADSLGVVVGLLADLPSSRPRLGPLSDTPINTGVRVQFLDSQALSEDLVVDGKVVLPVDRLSTILGSILPAQRIMLLDGQLTLTVEAVTDSGIDCAVTSGDGIVKAGNSLIFPDSSISFKMVTEEDERLLHSLFSENVSLRWAALSMVSSSDDVLIGRNTITEIFSSCGIAAKIETKHAISNVSEIAKAADALMLARGDLVHYVGHKDLPSAQDAVVREAHRYSKPIWIATEYLERLGETGIPSRPEVSDLSLAVRQCVDAIVLCKETVYSRNSLQCITFASQFLEHESERLSNEADSLSSILRSAETTQKSAPYLVTIEGTNGVGKSSVCRLITPQFGIPYRLGVPDEWLSIKAKVIADTHWLSSALFYISGYIEVCRIIQGQNEQVAILDRSLWSTLAVHYSHDSSRMPSLLNLLRLILPHILIPQLTIVLTAERDVLDKRIQTKSGIDRTLDLLTSQDAFLQKEMEFYRWLEKEMCGCRNIDTVFLDTSTLEPSAVVAECVSIIRRFSR